MARVKPRHKPKMELQKYFDLIEYEVTAGDYKDFRIVIIPGRITALDGDRKIASSDFGTKYTSYNRGALNVLTAIRMDITITSARLLVSNVSKDAKKLLNRGLPQEVTKIGSFVKSKIKDITGR